MGALTVTPFLMFQGEAAEALALYEAVVPGATVDVIERYGPGEPKAEGSLKRAMLRVGGLDVMVFESPVTHAFSFTPSFSFFVDCGSEEELRTLAAALGDGGSVMMPVGSYGFSTLFAWVGDRFGVSWQLNVT